MQSGQTNVDDTTPAPFMLPIINIVHATTKNSWPAFLFLASLLLLCHPTQPLAQQNTPLTDSEPIIITLKQEKLTLSEGILALFSHQNDTLYLPFGELCQEIGLGIQVDVDQQRAHGFVLQEDHPFLLNLTTKQVKNGQATFTIADQTVIPHHSDLFVSLPTLNQWFTNITFDFSFTPQRLEITSTPLLPATQRWLRQQRQASLETRTKSSDKAKLQHLFPGNYEAWSPPLLDVTYKAEWDIGETAFSSLQLSGAHDLAWSSSQWYLELNQDDLVEDFRIKFTRQDPSGRLFMPLGLTEIKAGDISLPSLPLISRYHSGTGLYFTNRERNIADGATTELRGPLPPNWDAELYHNGIFIRAIDTPVRGEYFFPDIALNPGENKLTVKLYGPQGQEKEVVERVRLDANQPAPGKYFFELSALFDDQDFFPLQEWVDPDAAPHRLLTEETNDWHLDNLTASGRFRFGLAPGLSGSIGGMSSKQLGERHNFATLSTAFSKFNSSILLDSALNTRGGVAAGLTGMSHGFLLRHTSFHPDFVRTTTSNEDILRNSTRFTLPSLTSLIDFPFDLRLTTQYDQFLRRNSFLKVNARSRLNFNRLLASHRLTGYFSDNTHRIDGQLNLRSPKENWGRLFGQFGYELTPDFKIKELSLKHRITLLDKRLQLNTGLSHDLDLDSTSLDFELGFMLDKARIAYNFASDLSSNDFTTGLTVSFSLTPQKNSYLPYMSRIPATRMGMAKVHLFTDNNSDGRYNAGDTPLPDTKLRLARAISDQNGKLLVPVPEVKPVLLQVNEDSLPDPFMKPTSTGYWVNARKGRLLEIPLPVRWVSDVEGTVLVTNAKQNQGNGQAEDMAHELGNIKLLVLNQQGQEVMQTQSEYDGFFALTALPTGQYQLRIAPDQAKKFHFDDRGGVPFQLHNDTTILPGLNLNLYRVDSTPLGTEITQQTHTIPERRAGSQAHLTSKLPIETVTKIPEQLEQHTVIESQNVSNRPDDRIHSTPLSTEITQKAHLTSESPAQSVTKTQGQLEQHAAIKSQDESNLPDLFDTSDVADLPSLSDLVDASDVPDLPALLNAPDLQ